MAKIKLTKGELKRQRDYLRQYEHYLPTLQLKKQQLQIEIFRQNSIMEEKKHEYAIKLAAIELWSKLLADPGVDIKPFLKVKEIIAGAKNIAGTDIPVFERAIFIEADYDLYLLPLWVDSGIENLRQLIALLEEIKTVQIGIDVLKTELRLTSQRVNLFEKVKIPESKEAIRLIKIYIGDQMANAVGRSKIAKRKIEETVLEEVSLAA